jgi:hypothetical protein
MNYWSIRYRLSGRKRLLKRYLSRKWELFRTPKAERPVKKAIWAAYDELHKVRHIT